MLQHIFRFTIVCITIVILSVQTSFVALAQENSAPAHPQIFADWFYTQTWSQENLELLNEKAAIAYREVTGSPVSVEDLMNRNTFYWYWPDFEAHALAIYPANNLACVIANAYNGTQIYYLDTGIHPYFVSTLFHENIHTDVFYEDNSFSESFNTHLDFIESAYGFDVQAYGGWDYLQYFEEAFADYADAYIMRQLGFKDYYEYGSSYFAGVEILAPMLEKLMENGITFRQIYELHSQSDIETMFSLMGEIYSQENGRAVNMNSQSEILLNGYSFAMSVHIAIANQMVEQSNVYVSTLQEELQPTPSIVVSTQELQPTPSIEEILTQPLTPTQPEITQSEPVALGSPMPPVMRFRPTCQMWLRFSQQQYMDINRTFDFQPDDFYLEQDGDWYIIEEAYYAVIDRP